MAVISVQTRKFADLTEITSVSDDAMLIIHDGKGVKKVSTKNLKADVSALITGVQSIIGTGAGAHNSIYRGKRLGSSVTAAQWKAIKNGTFEDLYIGDYWQTTIARINTPVRWTIASFDYFAKTGDTTDAINATSNTRHVVIVPQIGLESSKFMNTPTVADNSGGYVNSYVRTTYLAPNCSNTSLKQQVYDVFGKEHIFAHRDYLINATDDGIPAGGAWFDSEFELMSEKQVYGSNIKTLRWVANAAGKNDVSWGHANFAQFQLFALNSGDLRNTWRDGVSTPTGYWLRDAVSGQYTAVLENTGLAEAHYIGYSRLIRPYFCIYQA